MAEARERLLKILFRCEHGAALRPRDPRHAGAWLSEMIEDGVLAGTAWTGFLRLPHDGTRRIARAVRASIETGAP